MILSLLTACTGVIVLSPSTEPDPAAGVEPIACEDVLPTGVTAELTWTVPLTTYGDWGGVHAFSPDGDQLVTAADVYSPSVFTFETADGSYSLTTGEVYPWSRDEDWTVETRGVGWDGGAVVDLLTGDELVSEHDLGDAWNGQHSVISGDGTRVAAVDCEHGFTRVDVWEVRSGLRVLDLTVPGGCDYSVPGPGQVALDHDGTTLFSAQPEHGGVLRIGVDEGSLDIFQAHAEVEPEYWTSTGFVHSVTLLEGEDVLVTTGADGWLRQWDPVTLTPIAPDQGSVGTLVNENLYANPATYSPVDRSPDGTLLAALDAAGELVLQRACDGVTLATLPIPDDVARPGWSEDPGAVAVDFHPAGDRVAVRYEDSVALWTLTD